MERLLDNEELVSHMLSVINIKNSSEYSTLSDLYVSEDSIQKYAANIHHLLNKYGQKEAFKKTLNIMRVSPLVAIRILERCELNVYSEDIYMAIKMLVYALKNEDEGVILNEKIPFGVMLIEAAFSDLCLSRIRDDILMHVKNHDKELYTYKQWNVPNFLTPQNIRHIFQNVPPHRQIEFINWFWRQHLYAVVHYNKIDTYSSRCVDAVMKAMYRKSLWSHFENETFVFSEEERLKAEAEKFEVRFFIESVIQNDYKKHLPYVQNVLGEENFLKKFKAIMGCTPTEMGCPDLEQEIRRCREEMALRKEEGRRVYARRQKQRAQNLARKRANRAAKEG